MLKNSTLLFVIILTLLQAKAGYLTATSAPIKVTQIYTAESSASPYVKFEANSLPNCNNNNGAFLFDLTMPTTADNYKTQRSQKMAIALSSKLTNTPVIITYKYDLALKSTWDACIITGMYY